MSYRDKGASWLFLVFCLLIITPLGLVIQPTDGLDASWQIAMSLAERSHLTFGRDVIFTFGPLDFLCTRYSIVHSAYWLLLFDAFLLLCCGIVLRDFLQRYRSWRQRLLFLPVLFALKMASLIHLLMPLVLFFTLHYAANRRPFALVLSSLLAALSFYIKVNYGIMLIAMQTVSLVYFFIRDREARFSVAGIFLFQAAVLLAPAPFLHVSLPGYIAGSLHLISAFNDAMYLTVPWTGIKFILALSIIALFFSLLWFARKDWIRSPDKILACLLCSFYLYLIFKNGFVRGDSGHINEFFRLSLVPFVLLFYSSVGADLPWNRTWVLVCLLVLVFVPLMKTRNDRLALKNEFFSLVRFEYVRDALAGRTDKRFSFSRSASSVRISPRQVSLIGRSSVDIIPWEISEIYAHDLVYDPRPVIQSYSAYDGYLDRKNFDKYMSPSAPEFLLFSLMTTDDRYAFWDESITKRAILSRYELVSDGLPGIGGKRGKECFDAGYYLAKNPDLAAAITEGMFHSAYDHYQRAGRRGYRPACGEYEVVLLKKRIKPLEARTVSRQDVQLTLNEEFRVGESESLLYLSADVHYNWLGRFLRIFFQPPPLRAIIKYEDGTTESYRAVVPIVKTGVLINRKITTTAEAADFFYDRGANNGRIVGITLEAGYGFAKHISAVLEEMKFVQL